ncbi:MAG: hypothetical protein H6953_15300 [Chromatiaceae bacterium]|nr:hypothetical protein [Chromatiaceae bacterium]
MDSLSLADWSSIAQVVIAGFTVVGVIASLFMSARALREVQTDRRQRQIPHLAFERGGYRYPIKFVKAGRRVPGVEPEAAERLLSGIPEAAESVRIDHGENKDGSVELLRIGRLKNYGLGPAISTHVCWKPRSVWFGSEKMELSPGKPRVF